MADVLKPGDASTFFWPVDKVILAYFCFTTVLVAGWWNRIPHAGQDMAWHVAAIAVLLVEVKRPNPTSWAFRNWYPLLYVSACYREMVEVVPAVRDWDGDGWLAGLDFRFWHANPTVWLERIESAPLTELLQAAYTLFIPAVLLVAAILWKKRFYREFQYYAFLIAAGFLVSYIGYLIVPARGPRVFLKHLQHIPLQGLWLFHGMQLTLDRLESAAYDCFPSGHTELTLLACWGSRMVSNRLFRVYFAYTPLLIFATVYLRYHYSVDLMAGAVAAAALVRFAPALYRKLSRGRNGEWVALRSSRSITRNC
jgi:membrane-associated phospholipid phosphatase